MATKRAVPFTFLKDGIYYFTRRVPSDLRDHYLGDRVAFSLRTNSARVAEPKALSNAHKLDEFWLSLRMRSEAIPGQHLVKSIEELQRPSSPLLSEARDIYLRAKGHGKAVTFSRAAHRTVEYLVASKGDKPLLSYTKGDATSFRDELFDRELTGSSVVRVLATLRVIFSFALSEGGITAPNPFTGIYVDRSIGVMERQAFTGDELKLAQKLCRESDDDLRWLVALISDTGMRLAEAAGLATSDIVIDAEIPHVRIQPHPWRSLKTKSSERVVPLVGSSLWAARRIVASNPGQFAFPRYTKDGHTNANSASAALNKWLTEHVSKTAVIHSFRHSLRDRLRAVECPSEIADEIGGWAKVNVGQNYGQGYRLDILERWMSAIVLA